MTTRVHAQVIFQGRSNLPRDRYINTFSFSKDSGEFTGPDFSHISQALTRFYGSPPSGDGDAIGAYLSRAIMDEPDPVINFYDANAVGSPIGVGSILGYAPSGTAVSLPNEVALCLSFFADMTGAVEEGPVDISTGKKTRPKSRRRGRIYIGPLTASALIGSTSTNPGRPDPTFTDIVRDAASRLMHDPDGDRPGTTWCIHSRRDDVFRPVIGGFVDDEFDTQRRRQPVSTSRLTFS